MKTGFEQVSPQNNEQIDLIDVLTELDIRSENIQEEALKTDTLHSLIELSSCIESTGYDKSLEMLFSDELLQLGITSDLSKEDIVNKIDDYIDSNIAIESAEAVIVGFYLIIIIASIIELYEYHKNLKLISGAIDFSKIDNDEFDKVIADKIVSNVLDAKMALEYYEMGTGIIKEIASYTSDKLLTIEDVKKFATKLKGYYSEKSGKIVVDNKYFKEHTVKALGWNSKTIKHFATVISKNDNIFADAYMTVENFKKSSRARSKDSTKWYEFSDKFKNWKDRRKVIVGVRSAINAATDRIIGGGRSWLQVVKMSKEVRRMLK
jgi:hypothetical protein